MGGAEGRGGASGGGVTCRPPPGGGRGPAAGEEGGFLADPASESCCGQAQPRCRQVGRGAGLAGAGEGVREAGPAESRAGGGGSAVERPGRPRVAWRASTDPLTVRRA